MFRFIIQHFLHSAAHRLIQMIGLPFIYLFIYDVYLL